MQMQTEMRFEAKAEVTTSKRARFGVRLVHLTKGWRYLVFDRSYDADKGLPDFLPEDYATEEAARDAVRQQFGVEADVKVGGVMR